MTLNIFLIEVADDLVAFDPRRVEALVYDPPSDTTTVLLVSGESVLLRGMTLHDVFDAFEAHMPLGGAR